MSIDLSCYVDASTVDVDATLMSLSKAHPEIFSRKFLLSTAGEVNSIHKEIALEYGLHAKSYFLATLNDNNSPGLVLQVANLIKKTFDEGKIIVLHGNEHLM